MIDTLRHNFGMPSSKYVLMRVDPNRSAGSIAPRPFRAESESGARVCRFIPELRSRKLGVSRTKSAHDAAVAADRDLFSNVEADEKVVRC